MARDFKEFIRIAGLTHVRTSPYYPQSNGKIERWHKSLKRDCIRPGVPLNLQDARRLVTRFVEHYNTVRLHSAIGYITPADKLAGKEEAIFAARDQKLLQARETRKAKRNQQPHPLISCHPNFFQLTLNQYRWTGRLRMLPPQLRNQVRPIRDHAKRLGCAISTGLSWLPA